MVGSGPAGLAAANQLNRAGHAVTVFERDEGPGGLLRFGVPDPKLEKWVIDRRVAVLAAEGIAFEYGADVGRGRRHRRRSSPSYDAVVLAIGSRVHRPLGLPGTDLAGVRFAMDYLYARNRWVARGDEPDDDPELTAAGKHVVIIGGGDTAMDCLEQRHPRGRRERHGAGHLPGAARCRRRATASRGRRRRAGSSPPTRSTRAASGAGRRPPRSSRAATARS